MTGAPAPPAADDGTGSGTASRAQVLADELVALAVGVAREAGELALSTHRQRDSLRVQTKSSSTDLVTEADEACERLIVERLLGARPDDGILGEEGASVTGTSGVRWVIDPIDGTTNYFYGHPGFAISIAAELRGTVIAAAVFDPTANEMFSATSGGGARRDGAPIRVRRTDALDQALVATGFGYDPKRRRRQAEVLTVLLPRIRDIRRMGAAAVDLCSVACGRVDAYFERGLNPWDLAAGWLIASEAGASVDDLRGNEPSSSFVLCASPAIAGPLGDILREADADQV